jgi:hypothetical protein
MKDEKQLGQFLRTYTGLEKECTKRSTTCLGHQGIEARKLAPGTSLNSIHPWPPTTDGKIHLEMAPGFDVQAKQMRGTLHRIVKR